MLALTSSPDLFRSEIVLPSSSSKTKKRIFGTFFYTSLSEELENTYVLPSTSSELDNILSSIDYHPGDMNSINDSAEADPSDRSAYQPKDHG